MFGTSTKAILPATKTVVARLAASSSPARPLTRALPPPERKEPERTQLARPATTPDVVMRKNQAISAGPLRGEILRAFERPARLDAGDSEMHQGQNHEAVLQTSRKRRPR